MTEKELEDHKKREENREPDDFLSNMLNSQKHLNFYQNSDDDEPEHSTPSPAKNPRFE